MDIGPSPGRRASHRDGRGGGGQFIESLGRLKMNDLYIRQQELAINPPASIGVVGVGGVGSWTALLAAIVGVRHLVLVDPEMVEISNLGRTPYRLDQVGQLKVEAMADLIWERREDCKVETYPYYLEQVVNILPHVVSWLDCRDTPHNEGWELPEPVAIAGYNGDRITLHLAPSAGTVFGEGPVRYSAPSWAIPPIMAAAFLIWFVCNPQVTKEECLFSGTLREAWDKIIGR